MLTVIAFDLSGSNVPHNLLGFSSAICDLIFPEYLCVAHLLDDKHKSDL